MSKEEICKEYVKLTRMEWYHNPTKKERKKIRERKRELETEYKKIS
jgi:hypothetical protein